MTTTPNSTITGDGSEEGGIGVIASVFIAITLLCGAVGILAWLKDGLKFLLTCCGEFADECCSAPEREEPTRTEPRRSTSAEPRVSIRSEPDTSTRTETRISTETDSNISDEVDQPNDERTSLLSGTAVSRFNEILERRGFHIDTNILEDIMNSVISEHSNLFHQNREAEGTNTRSDRVNARTFDRELEEYQRLFEIIRTDMIENGGGSSRERTIVEELCRIITPRSFDSSLSEDRSSNVPPSYNSLLEHNERNSEIPQPQSTSSSRAVVIRPPGNNSRHITVPPPPYVSVGDSDNLPSYDDAVEETVGVVSIPRPGIGSRAIQISQPDNTSHVNIFPPPPDISVGSPELPPSYHEYVYGVGYRIRNN